MRNVLKQQFPIDNETNEELQKNESTVQGCIITSDRNTTLTLFFTCQRLNQLHFVLFVWRAVRMKDFVKPQFRFATIGHGS